ncbi:phage virion morphogenesis protein [Alloacidobacterium dinghuense]|uniref:Phage virion morphogenesis protein n=1 Tax=Alloacidobacterium dinghuense TaxID=2763107 RepID=A0A7G8BPR2_9BACT|nr:phage virion morphogenesis protein [Alloacidobacterium dinghuense]QNI34532.1 phage virion morphogenesis protein [Alloacidobacterium dinghuense]
MTTAVIQVDSSRALVALGRFRLSLQENEELMRELGAAQLVSIRRTFREQGSPAGSWVPLSPNTIKRNPRKYGDGHKLLIDKGTLLNSITYRVQTGAVVIGTSLKYAAVHQFGSRDRSVAIGPQTEAESKATVDVKAGSYYRQAGELGTGKMKKSDKSGVLRSTRMKILGPRNASLVNARAHTRHQNIPPRPYLVFRPEDPGRLRGIVTRFVAKKKAEAGLGGKA